MKITSKVKSYDNLHNILRKVESLTQWEAEAGFDDTQHPEAEMSYAELAAIHELGIGVPERSFMTQAWHEDQHRTREFKGIVERVLYGNSTAKKELKQLSNKMAGTIKLVIEMGDFEPLAKITIRLKGHSRPLIETGALKENVKDSVVKKGES